MQSKVKLSKRQVKEDKFTTFMLVSKDKVQAELEEKWQYYLIGFVVFVVLIWAAGWHFSRQADLEVEAAEQFSKAMITYQTSGEQVAILEFSQIVDNYGGTAVAEQAVFYLGNLNLEARNYEDAIRFFQQYLSDYGDVPLRRAGAYAGIAAAHEDLGSSAEAAAEFDKAAAEDPGGALEADYLVGALRNYLALGDLEKAGTLLERLEQDHANSDWAKRATRMYTEAQAN